MSLFQQPYPNNIRTIIGLINVPFQDDSVLECDTALAAVGVQLLTIPANFWSTQYKLYIVDKSNNASVNNITITPPLGYKINGLASLVINTNGGSLLVRVTSNTDYVAQSSSSSGGGSGANYINPAPTTITVGGYAIGSDFPIPGKTMQEMWDGLLYPFVAPTFTSFVINLFPTSYEVGQNISGPKSFAWAFSLPSNVAPNTMDILDVTGATALATNISNTPPFSVAIASFTPVLPTTYSWRGQATNTNGGVFVSALFTASWFWRKYWGTSTSITLNETQIEALVSNALASTEVGTYVFAADPFAYKYFCWPDSFGSPTAVTGFKDAATGNDIPIAGIAQSPFYSNSENGFNYGIVAVTNAFSVTTNYRVYRSLNALSAAVTAIVS
jgi:hypothetical protein